MPSRSGDVSRDLAGALLDVLAAERGSSVVAAGLPGPGPRLQDLLDDAPLEMSVREGFDHWVQDAPDPGGELAAAMERANASVVPTAALSSVRSAYWCRMRDREHLRWVLPEDEEPLLDAMARLAPVGGLSLGAGTRYVGSFRAHGLLVPAGLGPARRKRCRGSRAARGPSAGPAGRGAGLGTPAHRRAARSEVWPADSGS